MHNITKSIYTISSLAGLTLLAGCYGDPSAVYNPALDQAAQNLGAASDVDSRQFQPESSSPAPDIVGALPGPGAYSEGPSGGVALSQDGLPAGDGAGYYYYEIVTPVILTAPVEEGTPIGGADAQLSPIQGSVYQAPAAVAPQGNPYGHSYYLAQPAAPVQTPMMVTPQLIPQTTRAPLPSFQSVPMTTAPQSTLQYQPLSPPSYPSLPYFGPQPYYRDNSQPPLVSGPAILRR